MDDIATQTTESNSNASAYDFNFHEFTDAISSMIELLDHESELLSQMKIREVGELQTKKRELTARLELQQHALHSKADGFNKLSNQKVDQLRQYSARFNESMKAYALELYKASKTNETIVSMVVDTVKEQVRTQNTYQNFYTTPARNGAEYMPAIKYNEQI
jgi:hypothetical protein